MLNSNHDLLIITHESVGDKMAGPGIRAWEMARALGAHGVSVRLASPFPSSRMADQVTISQYSWDDPQSVLSLLGMSRVVLAAGPMFARLNHWLERSVDLPTIVDLYYPEIERILFNLTLNRHEPVPMAAILDEMNAYLHQGDLFLCANEKQYDFWMGALMASGRLDMENLEKNMVLDHLVRIVPWGVPDSSPKSETNHLKGVIPGIGQDDLVIYWGGGVWDWMDPVTLLDAFPHILKQRNDVRLVFGSLHHFEKAVVSEMSVASRLLERVRQENWQDRYVFFLDWVPYDDRGAFLQEADLGVSIALPTIENRYAIRARLMDYLWTCLPCVISRGDEAAELLIQEGLGLPVSPGDAEGVSKAVLCLLEDRDLRNSKQARLVPLLQKLNWMEVVKPILEFLQNPALAPDGSESRRQINERSLIRKEWEYLRLFNQDLRQENQELHSEVDRLHRRIIVRLADRLARILHTR
jgi:glycosyltransferase involved in cell wall biosynthesis